MFNLFKPSLPISDEEQQWVDLSFVRLARLLGADRMLHGRVWQPIPADFPDRYDGSAVALRTMFDRVARGMLIDPETVSIDMFEDGNDLTRELVPVGSFRGSAPAGLYLHRPEAKAHIEVKRSKLKDPLSLVATLAHELVHVILLRPGLVARDEQDMELLTDLATVFLGFGVFNANAAFQFKQFNRDTRQGWSTSRQGYLSEAMFGYALARFAFERGELKPAWAGHLTGNIGPYFKRSLAWLVANGNPLELRAVETVTG